MYIDTAPGRWFYKEIGDSADEWRAFFHKYRYRICCGSDSMFFKNDDKLFPYRTLDDNIEVYQNMEKFFFGHGTILDPFPRKKQEEICSLGLDVNDERLIENKKNKPEGRRSPANKTKGLTDNNQLESNFRRKQLPQTLRIDLKRRWQN